MATATPHESRSPEPGRDGGDPADAEREDLLLDSFVSLAEGLVRREVPAALERLLDRSVSVLGVSSAGLLLTRPRGRTQVVTAITAGTGGGARALLEVDAPEDPCRRSVRTGEAVLVDDVASTVAQWPTWAPLALRNGVASLHVLPMRLDGRSTGALALFGDRPRRLSARDQRVAQALADVAAVTVVTDEEVRGAEELTAQLQTALDSRIVIEQAKGIVAASLAISVDEAFVVIRDHSRSTNRRIVDLAGDLSAGRATVDSLLRRPR